METASAGALVAPAPYYAQSRRTTYMLGATWFFTGAAYGCVLPFVSVYAARRGLSLTGIGILGAVGAGAAGTLQPVLGRLLDRTGRPRTILTATCAAGAIGCAGLGYAAATPIIFACFALAMIGFFGSRAVIVPATMNVVERAGKGAAMYARYRVWPPIGFTLTGIGGGVLLGHAPFAALFSLASVFYILTALCGHALPAPAPRDGTPSAPVDQPETATLARRVLITLALMSLLYGALTSSADTYVSLLMRHLHGSFFEVGLATSVVTLAEIPLMIVLGSMADRGRRALLLTLGMAFLPSRYFLFAIVHTPVQLLGAQFLDGPTFSAFAIVGVALLSEQTPRADRAWALSVYSAAGTLGPIAGPLLAGVLAAHIGLQPMFGLFGLGAVVVPAAVIVGLWPLLRGQPDMGDGS